jgi:hypothetical protein
VTANVRFLLPALMPLRHVSAKSQSSLSKDARGRLVDELIEEGGAFGLAVSVGVVAPALQGGPEFDGGLEVGTGFAGGFHAEAS